MSVIALPSAEARDVLRDLDSEFSTIGCLLKNAAVLDRLINPLRSEYFSDPLCQLIFEHLCAERKRGVLPDVSQVFSALAHEDVVHVMGGRPFFGQLVIAAAHPRAIDALSNHLRDMSIRRRLRDASMSVANSAQDIKTPIESCLMEAETSISDVCKGSNLDSEWIEASELVDEVDYVISPEFMSDRIKTGLRSFDTLTGGIRPAKLTVLAARASMGKSTVALSIAANMARDGYGVCIFSLEMDKREVSVKLGCGLAYDPIRSSEENPSPYYADRGKLYDRQKERMALAIRNVRSWPLSIDDRASLAPSQILTSSRHILRTWEKRGITPGAIFVDHLHVVRPEIDRGGNRVQELGDISGFLTDLAKQTGVAVVAMAQLNREVEGRANKDKRPQLSDLRGCGKIEEDAYMVAFIYRPEYYLRKPEDDKDLAAMAEYEDAMSQEGGKLKFIVEKNRGGARGQCDALCSMQHSAVW